MIIRRKAANMFSAVLFVAAANVAGPAFAADALGTWYTADRESQVKIVNCGGALASDALSCPACGKLTHAQEFDALAQHAKLAGQAGDWHAAKLASLLVVPSK